MDNRTLTKAETEKLGKISIELGKIYWQNDVGSYSNQVAIILKQQERLNQIVSDLLLREL